MARLDELFDEGEKAATPAGLTKTVLITTILASVAAASLETVPGLRAGHSVLFGVVEALATLIFAAEYLGRLWTAPAHQPDAPTPGRARLRYVTSTAGVVDLLAILPLPVGLLGALPADWVRVLGLLRLLKLGRYAPALPLFVTVLRNEGRSLLAALVVMLTLLVVESGIMYALERHAQPNVFASVPHAMWWAIVTMATVGYGDTFPVTPLGKVFAGLVMVLGIAMFAVPAGILATGFAAELRRRDFMVTWQTVARVPLFAGLDAGRIAEIARLLRREIVPAKYVVVRRGEPADSMYFIMTGEVEVDVQPTPRRMGHGQFFGEIALLRDTVRTATVATVTECELLSLDVADFRRLLDSHPDVKAWIVRVAEERLGLRSP